jgi:hypothetical protein
MPGGKYHFSAMTRDGSSKSERKSPNSRTKKTNGAERKNVRRQHISKSDNRYETAVLSVTIKR